MLTEVCWIICNSYSKVEHMPFVYLCLKLIVVYSKHKNDVYGTFKGVIILEICNNVIFRIDMIHQLKSFSFEMWMKWTWEFLFNKHFKVYLTFKCYVFNQNPTKNGIDFYYARLINNSLVHKNMEKLGFILYCWHSHALLIFM